MSDTKSAYKDLINWLEEMSTCINDFGVRARKASQDDKDANAYNAIVTKKAETIKSLAGEAEKYLAALPAAEADSARQRITEFSRMAEKALGLNSFFFMSLLLVSDEEGQPNSLEVLIEDLKKAAAQ